MTPKELAALAIAVLYDKLLPREPIDQEIVEAVLSAIETPSKTMIKAGARECTSEAEAFYVWRKMHAAMMAEKDTGE